MQFKEQSIILNNRTIASGRRVDFFRAQSTRCGFSRSAIRTPTSPSSLPPRIGFGNRASAPVDNLVAGGMSSLIDLESGTLSAAAERAKHGLIMHDVHPDTGSRSAVALSRIRRL
jgi:hypothetical protein